LLDQVNGVQQAIITTTDPAFFDDDALSQMALFKVESGRVSTMEHEA